jgi:hypothetical protein
MMNKKIEIKRNHVPYINEKIKLFNSSKTKILKVTKKIKINGEIKNYIKKDVILFLKNKDEIDYKFALEFIILFSEDYIRIKERVRNGELNPEKIKEESFWINPSKDLVLFFSYTFLYEMYHDHLVQHLAYMEKCSTKEVIIELIKY